MAYVLGHRPDEFGLVPNAEGFVTYKDLLKAVHEEPGWHYVQRSHINEVLMNVDRSLFRIEEDRIAAVERHWQIELDRPAELLPKILLTPVRRKAHPVVMEKGLKSATGRYLVLSPDEEMAERIGRRIDQKPVLLQISTAAAEKGGAPFYAFGDLFLSRELAAGFIVGPLVSKEVKESPEAGPAPVRPKPADFAPGTFTLDKAKDPDPARRLRGKKRRGWKEEARKIRRGKP
jgi:putative RNA 2'-phosphotransferase